MYKSCMKIITNEECFHAVSFLTSLIQQIVLPRKQVSFRRESWWRGILSWPGSGISFTSLTDSKDSSRSDSCRGARFLEFIFLLAQSRISYCEILPLLWAILSGGYKSGWDKPSKADI
ncbi:unnamed protein product [Ixodes pacificus]